MTAAAGPVVASLVGDYFPGRERGRIYSFVLTGELVGAGVGFAVTGDIAALSWRAAFVILAIPAFILAYLVFHLPEPVRGGQGALLPDPEYSRSTPDARESEAEPGGVTDAQRLTLDRHIAPDPRLVREGSVGRMGFIAAARYVLHVRTNVALIISGACGYYFLAGVQTFGVEFVHAQYHVNQVLANLLMLVVGGGAAAGILVAGPLGDRLLRNGHLKGRIQVAAFAAVATVVLFVPALVTHSSVSALPYIVLAGAALSAQNPPIDAARLDIVPASLWGRAEGIRTFVRTGAQALAPLLFGAVSDLLSGSHPYSGLRWTFVIMLLPLERERLLPLPGDADLSDRRSHRRDRGPGRSVTRDVPDHVRHLSSYDVPVVVWGGLEYTRSGWIRTAARRCSAITRSNVVQSSCVPPAARKMARTNSGRPLGSKPVRGSSGPTISQNSSTAPTPVPSERRPVPRGRALKLDSLVLP